MSHGGAPSSCGERRSTRGASHKSSFLFRSLYYYGYNIEPSYFKRREGVDDSNKESSRQHTSFWRGIEAMSGHRVSCHFCLFCFLYMKILINLLISFNIYSLLQDMRVSAEKTMCGNVGEDCCRGGSDGQEQWKMAAVEEASEDGNGHPESVGRG